jgi:SnoaL-like domain
MSRDAELLGRVYERFSARDMEVVLAARYRDVIWANGTDGGYVHGHDGVRRYWTRQWAMIDPHVEPIHFSAGAEAEVVVEVHQAVRDLAGKVLSDKMAGHILGIESRLVRRLDLRAS